MPWPDCSKFGCYRAHYRGEEPNFPPAEKRVWPKCCDGIDGCCQLPIDRPMQCPAVSNCSCCDVLTKAGPCVNPSLCDKYGVEVEAGSVPSESLSPYSHTRTLACVSGTGWHRRSSVQHSTTFPTRSLLGTPLSAHGTRWSTTRLTLRSPPTAKVGRKGVAWLCPPCLCKQRLTRHGLLSTTTRHCGVHRDGTAQYHL